MFRMVAATGVAMERHQLMRAYERHPRTDARQMRQLAVAQGLTSYMSNTRWRGVFALFGHWSDPPPRFRVFDPLAGPEPSAWTRLWHGYPRPFVSLRWIEVELPPPEIPRAIGCLREGIPAYPTETGVRIWGWIGGDDRLLAWPPHWPDVGP